MEHASKDPRPQSPPPGSHTLPHGVMKAFKPAAPQLKPAARTVPKTLPVFKFGSNPPTPQKPPQPLKAITKKIPSPPAKSIKPPPFPFPGKTLPKLRPSAAGNPPPNVPLRPSLKPPPADLSNNSAPDAGDQAIFREEVKSYLPLMKEAFEHLNLNLQDSSSWLEIKIRFHAIKGAANTVGFPDLASCAAAAEQGALEACEFPEKRSQACKLTLIHALKKIATALNLALPEITEVSAPTSPDAPTPGPDIAPVIAAFKQWQHHSKAHSRNAFLSIARKFCASLDKNHIGSLHSSFLHLTEFCEKSSSASPPPEIFFSVIHHALDDARDYLAALDTDPGLRWSRKWGFYFSSLQIAMASQTSAPAGSDPPPDALDPEMMSAFIGEATEIFQLIETSLLSWENGTNPTECQAVLRRHFHTLKGAANSVGLSRLGADFHILEDAMDHAEREPAPDNLLPRLFQCLDEARRYVTALQTDIRTLWPGDWKKLLHPESLTPDSAERENTIEPDMLEVFVEEAENLLNPIESAIMSLEVIENPQEQYQTLRRHFHTLKGAANSVGLTDLGAEFHALEDFMDVAAGSTDVTAPGTFLLHCLDNLRSFIPQLQHNPKLLWPHHWSNQIASLRDGHPPDPTRTPDSAPAQVTPLVPTAEKQMLRVEALQLQELMQLISELVAEQGKIQDYVTQLQSLHQDLQELSRSSELSVSLHTSLKQLSLKIYTLRDRLDSDDQLFRRYAKRIQSDLVEINMGPVSSLFHRLSRSFRDACHEEKKDARWIAEGGDVQLDRSLVDHLYAPLLHVVRNAVAHGIESPQQRQERGKSSTGTVKIQATPGADHVNIEIIDDGAGISEETIRIKAIKNGLLDKSVTSISTQEAVELLFSPGFSTKDTVSNVAGRGVGLDAVKRDIEGLNGSVGVTYVHGQGTRWKIRVPLTLSAAEALLVQADDFKVALPLGMVDRCSLIAPDQIKQGKVLHSITVDNESLPLLHLGHFLGARTPSPPSHAVLIDSGLDRAVLGVSALLHRREIVTRDPGPLLSPLSYLSGFTSDSDGKLLPILQIPYLLDWISKHNPSASEIKSPRKSAPATLQPNSTPTILLADDSPSVQKVQKKQLSKLGFSVLLAGDGQEALDILNSTSNIDLVVTDWEMPRIDGSQLLQNIRKNSRHHDLPVIVISSKVNHQFNAEVLEQGANASLCKPFQSEQFFHTLQTIPELSTLIPKLDDSGLSGA